MSDDLLGTARRLARMSASKPRQSDLKRSISTAYYALFHAVARCCADRVAGASTGRPDKAWRQVYRALNHGDAKKACAQLRALGFPTGLIVVGDAFKTLQEQRHSADYDPVFRVTRADALAAVATAEAALVALRATNQKDRTALAVHLLLKSRT